MEIENFRSFTKLDLPIGDTMILVGETKYAIDIVIYCE